MLMINAENEVVVRNSANVEIFNKVKNPQNKLMEYAGADHTTISIELEYSDRLVADTVRYFDSILQIEGDGSSAGGPTDDAQQ
jgi:hypothetical protein